MHGSEPKLTALRHVGQVRIAAGSKGSALV